MKTGHTSLGNKAVCLLCWETVAVFKEYNLKPHHQTKHGDFGRNMSDKEQRENAVDCVMK